MANKHICIDEVKGCEGNCITMNDYRVAGPKPWGGGIVVKNWVADVDDVIMALRDNDVVEVVRCKDCKWSRTNTNDHEDVYYCEFRTGRAYHSGDFCSYGEKR